MIDDNPLDPNWNWGQNYATQTLEITTPHGIVLHLIIRRHNNQPIIIS